MKIYLKWLQELVDLTGLDLQEIVEKISLYATEVEGVTKLIDATHLVVGHVLTKVPHPNSDHLSVLTVDVGEKLQIVCGAPNVQAKQTVIVALEGATLPGDFKIKRSKIRGVESCGMVCSLQELGIDKKFVDEQYASGIYYFEDEKPVGMRGDVALEMDGDIIEIDVMPNRGDLLSMIGVAYELSAVFNRPLKKLIVPTINRTGHEHLSIELINQSCLSYYAQVIKNITIKPSPQWLKARLIAFGVRPINNVVDITNYIMALFGQPLHAFDYDLLGSKIVVRFAKDEESIVTLDGISRSLVSSDLLITNGKTPVAIAGVMGGMETEVHKETTQILIEAAVFDPLIIRKTSTRLGLRSEASMRYERGVDCNMTKMALDYASYLLVMLADGEVVGEPSFQGIAMKPDQEIDLSLSLTQSILGYPISLADITPIFTRLHLAYELNGDVIRVQAPNRRRDLQIPEDLIEEIGRLNGYDKIPLSLPNDDRVGFLNDKQKKRRLIKNTLFSLGLHEVITYSLVKESQLCEFSLNHHPSVSSLPLLMPLSEDRKIMRLGLLPSLLEVVQYNYSRKNINLALFEIGNVYYSKGGNNYEEEWLSGAMSNQYSHTLWQQKEEKVDFFLVKGILLRLFETLGVEVVFQPLAYHGKELHPTRCASIVVDDKVIGFMGQLHPQYELEHDLDDVIVFEINIASCLNEKPTTVMFVPLNKLPSIERDLAFVVKKEVLASDLVAAIRKTDRTILSDVQIFDLYEGEKISSELKSIAMKVIFTSDEPLKEEQIQQKIQKIVKDLKYRFDANLRSS
ncbi:MAG: phenylalanine--tRNA ligase subunit beta [Bacilli bacterium]